MKYVGMQSQISKNNALSVLLLLLFPVIILGTIYVFLAVLTMLGGSYHDSYGNLHSGVDWETTNEMFLQTIPWVIGIVGLWFVIAYFYNTAMIKHATGARPLERRENPRVYNIVENLTIACGMDMPQINIIDDPQLNAFASGIDKKSYTVTLTTGIINMLDDNELAGVVGHELTHIRNKDTRLLITSIIFVGILSTIMTVAVRLMVRSFLWGGTSSRSRDGKNNGASVVVILLVAVICSAIAYFFTMLTRFAISRKREYMADAGGAELCGNPWALASALRKISNNPGLTDTGREDVAQLFIVHPKLTKQGFMSFFNSLFSTHPDPAKRIAILEQF